MHVIALLATYNEERFIRLCLEHLFRQGVDVYLIDNDSTDQTVPIAKRYLGRGLIGMERLIRRGKYSWRPILERKEQLAAELKADWYMHVDPDEIRLPPHSGMTIAETLEKVEDQGYNAVNFMEFTFVPTKEAPDHNNPHFQETMRWYYPYLPSFPNRLNLWKRQSEPAELVWSGGHQVRFPGLRMYPESFKMRHYLFLSVPHAITKYGEQFFDPAEVAAGWHRARAGFKPIAVKLMSQNELCTYLSDDQLEASNPRTEHPLFQSD